MKAKRVRRQSSCCMFDVPEVEVEVEEAVGS